MGERLWGETFGSSGARLLRIGRYEDDVEYFFYHLTHQSEAEVVPRLAQLCLDRDWRVVIRARQEATLISLSEALWSFGEGSFLAHAQEGDAAAIYAADQPIWLTTGEDAPNKPDVVMLLEDMRAGDHGALQRVIYLFNGEDPEALTAARAHWKEIKEQADIEISYWQQSNTGQWTQQA